MTQYHVLLPIYVPIEIEAENIDGARRQLDKLLRDNIVQKRVADGWFDIDSDPIIETEEEVR